MIAAALAFVRDSTQPHEREALDLLSVLECVVDDAKSGGGDASLEDAAPLAIDGDALALQRMFANLIDNAIKYAGDPPRVEVHVRIGERGRVIIRIIDNGLGVPHELRKRIFRMFFRAGSELTRRQKGTGLGLYIVHTLVKQLNGRISVHDRPGQSGSIFEVEIPGHLSVSK